MAEFQAFHFEELDDHSRDYLLNVRDRQGRGMPGVYAQRNDPLPVLGCVFGLIVLVGGGVLCWNVIDNEPIAVAMLETATLLLGGWLVAYTLRIWKAEKSSKYIGSFVYADGETLWECEGSTVKATGLERLAKSRGVQHFSKEGKYTHTAVSVRFSKGFREFKVNDEGRARDLVTFLNTIAWMRGGAQDDGPGPADNAERIDWNKQPPAIMGGAARAYAEHGRIPTDLSASGLRLQVTEIPSPRKDGNASSGIVVCLLIVLLAVGSVFLFKQLNIEWRDDAIWSDVNSIGNQDKRAPVLRFYLGDDRNVNHRDQAREMLRTIYQNAVARIRNGAMQNPIQGIPPFPAMPGVGAGRRINGELLDGLEVVLLQLVEQPQPVVSVSVKENGGDDSAKGRESSILKSYAQALQDGVGPELVEFVQAPEDVHAMIEITYDIAQVDGQRRYSFTFAFRKSPDDDPAKTVKTQLDKPGPPSDSSVGELAKALGEQTAGPKKIVLQPLD